MPSHPHPADLALTETDDGVVFSHRGAVLAEYRTTPDVPVQRSPRPYFSRLCTASGTGVIQSSPPDHPWHLGLSWALPVVGDENFWGGPTFVRGRGYEQLANNGRQQHVTFDELHDGSGSTGFVEVLTWWSGSGRWLVDERRTVSASLAEDSAWVLTFHTTMTNTSDQPLPLGSPTTHGRPDAGYGGFFWRGAPAFRGALVVGAGGAGTDDVRGTRGRWLGLSTQRSGDGPGATVLMVADAQGDRRASDGSGVPPEWFVRSTDYPGLCPAPFFTEEHPFDPGDVVRFAVSVVVADGASDVARASRLAEVGAGAITAMHAGLTS